MGWVISALLDAAAAASHRECTAGAGICVGVAPFIGLAFGAAVTITGYRLVMAVARIRPLTVTVPASITLMLLDTVIFLRVVSGGRLHPVWAFSLTTAFSLALLLASIAGSVAALRRARDRARP